MFSRTVYGAEWESVGTINNEVENTTLKYAWSPTSFRGIALSFLVLVIGCCSVPAERDEFPLCQGCDIDGSAPLANNMVNALNRKSVSLHRNVRDAWAIACWWFTNIENSREFEEWLAEEFTPAPVKLSRFSEELQGLDRTLIIYGSPSWQYLVRSSTSKSIFGHDCDVYLSFTTMSFPCAVWIRLETTIEQPYDELVCSEHTESLLRKVLQEKEVREKALCFPVVENATIAYGPRREGPFDRVVVYAFDVRISLAEPPGTPHRRREEFFCHIPYKLDPSNIILPGQRIPEGFQPQDVLGEVRLEKR